MLKSLYLESVKVADPREIAAQELNPACKITLAKGSLNSCVEGEFQPSEPQL